MIICKICKKEFPGGFMNWKHFQIHGLKPAEYKKKHGPFMTSEFSAARSKVLRKHIKEHGPAHAMKHSEATRKKLKEIYKKRMEGGELPLHTGHKHSKESKKKMSVSHKRVLKERPESKERSVNALKKHTKENGAWNKGVKFTLEQSKKLSAAHQGIPLEEWKGYASGERKRLMGQLKYRQWRKSVYERDKYTCVQCGETKKYLNADHIKSWAKHPKLRYEISNGRTLCIDCHEKTESYPKRLRRKVV